MADPELSRVEVPREFPPSVNVTVPDGVPADSGRSFLTAAKSFLAGDMVIGNFEGVLADSGESTKCDSEAGRQVGG